LTTTAHPKRTREERLENAFGNLQRALTDYDSAKADHKETTEALTEAKKRVDECARHLVDLKYNPQEDLFDRDREGAE
jgi:hypothetical protein